MQRTSEDYEIRDTLAALQRARSLENANDVRVLQHRLQTFSLHNILPLLQQARDQENFIIVQDLREAAVSIHAVTFEAMTDSDLRPAMAAARSAGDNLRIQANQRILDGRERERTRASLQHGGYENTECGICFDPLEIPRSDTLDFSISAANTTGTFSFFSLFFFSKAE